MKGNKNSRISYKIKEIRGRLTTRLKQAGINNPELEFDLLLASILNTTREKIISITEIDDEVKSQLETAINKRANRYPLQYLTNNANFCGFNFYIEENCFIPRFETEALVEEAITMEFNEMLEICCGIGNISISLGMKLKNKSIFISDTNLAALKIAKKNIARFKDKISRNKNSIILFASDLFRAIKPNSQFDLIIANPPYIAADDPNISEELKYEPYNSLFTKDDGYFVIKNILLDCSRYLRPTGKLLMEFGYNQHKLCEKIAENLGYNVKKIIIDEEGVKRGMLLSLQ